jgi:GNAT superfamily N-acetyltransferase
MDDTCKIRIAGKDDMPAVLTLIRELAAFEREADAIEVTVEDLQRDGFSEQPLFHCLVAEQNGSIIGMALYYFRYSTWKGRTIHLEDLIVSEKFRGNGAGFALLSRVIDDGKKIGVRRIEWNVLDWNTPAIEFYRRCGANILSDWRVVQLDHKRILGFAGQTCTENNF